MISSDIMNSRAYLFQLQAAEAAAAAAAAAVVPPVVHAADDDALEEPPTPKSTLLLEIEAQAHGTPDASPALEQQGSRVVPMCVGGIAEPTKCPECPKWFVSEKAMFGHLRKHPDRGYKGATRPPTAAPTATALAGGETKMSKTKQQVPRNEAGVSTMNLMMAAAATAGEKKKKPSEEELSTKWPVTAKRGRAPFAPAEAAGKQKQASSEDEEAAMILLGIASSSHSTTSETQQQASVQQQQAAVLHAPDAASGHQFPDGAEQQQPMLLDDHHVSMDNLTLIEAEQIVQPAGIVLEHSAESQTPPAAVKEITSVEVTTESLHQVVTVPATNKPVTVAPGSGSGGGAKKAKKQRRAGVVCLERRAAAFPAPPPEGADGGSSRAAAVWRIPSPASNKRHVCPTCGKWFSTYQALGGHMSSHVKAKSGFAGVAHEELAASQARHNNIVLAHRSLSGGGGGGLVLTTAGAGAGAGVAGWVQGLRLQDVVHQPPALMGTQGAGALHVCAVCHMTFPSGQALGGHKRKHWFPEKHQTTTKAAAAPVAEQAAAEPETAPTVRGFDLNEMPEEGEGESDQP